MRKRNHFKYIRNIAGSIGLALLVAACSEEHQSAPMMMVPQAVVQEVERKNITVETELPGRTEASVIAEVRPQVGGIILSVNFTEGSFVNEGDQLYQIDPATYKASLLQAEATLERAKANQNAARLRADRLNALKKSKAVSQQDVDDANAALMQANAEVLGAEAQVTNAKINLDYTQMEAPISGQIGRTNFTQGALVSPGQINEMAVIQVLNPMKVNITYSSAEYAAVRKKIMSGVYTPTKVENLETGEWEDGHLVRIYLEDGSLYDKVGYIKFSDLTVDPTTGSIFLQAQFENDGSLLPGMFVRTVVQQGIEEGALVVSQKAVTQGPGGVSTVVVIDEENIAHIRPVEISRSYEQDWVIAKGLNEGERVVVKGLQSVQSAIQRSGGQPVKVEVIPDDNTLQ
ncbi:efflux RND transporter periplasmic adaptor subunit [Ignatzschineria cameli]|uniref:Efflux RND transporter periplasmic adaptor subunit n=1 Tax=Ignatzschineria cameli TaxID=2182793 RepID=A0A2U2ARF0_9GAMM|nr:efflux RND transporter periplasmic adaptor subunit [Ignatzschineria cameli]PWD83517.1 efflux RND transporter periplasmic adaptor subunit [Ignatzschineria cameli]PWD86842.1 efflux RND transporter periplasmic adaptor subunit [Ignatzschineria cameli]PWD91816.1 efflux RND transporter periplasmic adaptor subunit [Ignatzschineria cameli]PWD93598.1 efflux RND transporter periplasmic adaptor subunit [Ignatzschineria cameli]PWD94340.1 efflux RND transporter periplasmic adaptor subunit [Ignatzschiner